VKAGLTCTAICFALARALVAASWCGIKPGSHVFIVAAAKQPDGSLTTGGINVGRDGVVPPM
jgi:hypothetical protein